MSEGSSAVLDLKDDIEESEVPPPVPADHGTEVHSPLIMEHGYDIAVKVDSPLKQLSTLETFVTYRVRCVCARWATPPHVRRRYNHFKVLYKRLCASYPLVAPPPLPPLHSPRQQLDRYDTNFVQSRAIALDAFLSRVAKHPIMTYSDDFRLFLTTPDDDLDRVFKSDNSALNLWGLSSALYGSGESKPANGPRVKDPEFTSAVDYLQSLEQKLLSLHSHTNKLRKETHALGTEYLGLTTGLSNWSSSPQRLHVTASNTSRACSRAGGVRRAGTRAGRAAALLPPLADYAHQHVVKIRARDSIHAAYVASDNSSDELHNRLEQASEALRSELQDWNTKTRAELKSILVELADEQVTTHRQTLLAWEHALNSAKQSNITEVFKTVSKTAVQNLSPSKCKNIDMGENSTLKIDDDLVENISIDDNTASLEINSTNSVENTSNLVDNSTSLVENSSHLIDNSASLVENVDSESLNCDSDKMKDPLQEFAEINLNEEL